MFVDIGSQHCYIDVFQSGKLSTFQSTIVEGGAGAEN